MDKKTKTELDNIVRVLTNTGNVSKIYLFGSYAKGKETPDSDIDLCVLTPRKDMRDIELTADFTLTLWQNIKPMPLDLLAYNEDNFYNHISKYPRSFEKDIVEEGVLIYER